MSNPYKPPSEKPDSNSGQESGAVGSGLSSAGRPAAMVFILITLFIDILGIGIVIPVLPELVKDFVGQGSISVLGWEINAAGFYVGIISSSYALMQFLFAPVLGALSDRFGRRPVLLASLFGLGVDFVIQGFAPSITWLFFARAFSGIMGASFSTANAYIADVSTPDNRAKNFGLSGAMFGLGFIFGPAIGGLLGSYSLRLPFFISAALALINWLYGYFVLPESLPREKRSSHINWARANPIGSLFVLREHKIVSSLAWVIVLSALAQRGLENVWVLYMGFKFGWNELQNGLCLGLVGVMAALVQGLLVKPIINWVGERKAVVYGLTIQSIVFACYGAATQSWMIPLAIMVGALGGVTGPAMQSIVSGSVESENQGKVQGALTSLISLTNIVSPLFFTTVVFSYFTSKQAVVQIPGAPLLVGSVFLLLAMMVARAVFNSAELEE